MFHPIFGFPTLRAAGPFEELSRMRRQMDQLMDTLFSRSTAGLGAGIFPALNLTEDDGFYYIRAELPGLKNSDIEVQATGNSITISGERRPDPAEEGAKYHRREREAGKFSRGLSIPKEIDAERVEARMANGVLTLRAPKAASAKPRKIAIGS
jgi:HSP20 family protein